MQLCKHYMLVQSKQIFFLLNIVLFFFGGEIYRFRQCVLNYDTLSSNNELLKSLQNLFAFLTLSQV
jgi:hypothetical protein